MKHFLCKGGPEIHDSWLPLPRDLNNGDLRQIWGEILLAIECVCDDGHLLLSGFCVMLVSYVVHEVLSIAKTI